MIKRSLALGCFVESIFLLPVQLRVIDVIMGCKIVFVSLSLFLLGLPNQLHLLNYIRHSLLLRPKKLELLLGKLKESLRVAVEAKWNAA